MTHSDNRLAIESDEEFFAALDPDRQARVQCAYEACIRSILELLLEGDAINKDEQSVQLAIDLALQDFAGWMLKRTEVESEVRRILKKA